MHHDDLPLPPPAWLATALGRVECAGADGVYPSEAAARNARRLLVAIEADALPIPDADLRGAGLRLTFAIGERAILATLDEKGDLEIRMYDGITAVPLKVTRPDGTREGIAASREPVRAIRRAIDWLVGGYGAEVVEMVATGEIEGEGS